MPRPPADRMVGVLVAGAMLAALAPNQKQKD
jgi:hypothetical protein